MRMAVLADIHSNRQALEAVLRKVFELAPDRTLCLGDIVGYHADPEACIELTDRHCDRIVQGNHDREVAGAEPVVGTTSVARAARRWTQLQLGSDHKAWLDSLPNSDLEPGRYLGVHGCYLNPEHIYGYVTETMLDKNLDAIVARGDWPQVAFCGHTHIPMCAWTKNGEVFRTTFTDRQGWPTDAGAVLINPGSVGQPRDFDARASFALVDFEQRIAEVHRVAYDVEAAIAGVARAGLPESLQKRLRDGR